MNTKDFTYLLNRPYSISEKQTQELEQILIDFPYLQSARAIQLKGLYNLDSFRYNTELKKTAAHTTDRSVLFDFITSEYFQSVQKGYLEEQEKQIAQIYVTDGEVLKPADKLEESIKLTIKEAIQHTGTNDSEPEVYDNIELEEEPIATEIQKNSTEQTEEKLEIGKPLDFVKSEKHSFQEWLQLSRLTPIAREQEEESEKEKEKEFPVIDEAKTKKLELIDRFIESNPKIVPDRNNPPSPAKIEKSTQDTSYLMTETLARVYLEQKKYSKAIQAYEILILKYPEKSVFFADRISDIKILQQNNN